MNRQLFKNHRLAIALVFLLSLLALPFLDESRRVDVIYIGQFLALSFAIVKFSGARLLKIGLIFLVAADLLYYGLVYKLAVSTDSYLVVFATSSLYGFSFAAIIYFLVHRQLRTLLSLSRQPLNLPALLFFVSVAVIYLLVPGSSKLLHNGPSPASISHLITICCSLPLVLVAYFYLISSISFKDQFVLVGLFILGLLDIGIQLETILYGNLQFSFYDVLWFLGIGLISLFLNDQSFATDLIDGPSIVNLVKNVFFLVALFLITVASVVLGLGGNVSPTYFLFSLVSIFIFGIACSSVIQFGINEYNQKLLGYQSIPSLLNLKAILTDSPIEFRPSLDAIYQKALEKEKLAAQVAHDIRSPLSALNIVLKCADTLPEEERLVIRNATQRINDIANALLGMNKISASTGEVAPSTGPKRAEPVMLASLLDAIVSEKRAQYRNLGEVEIRGNFDAAYGLFANIGPTEISRVISNLLNNSMEAIPGSGCVTISIRGDQASVFIYIADNGIGIPENVLKRMGEFGFSHGKAGTDSGSGIGFAHAQEIVQKAGGKITVQSAVNVGTNVTIELPRAAVPEWFVEKVVFPSNSVIVTIDDDQTIHQVWDLRLASSGDKAPTVERKSFTSLDRASDWIATVKNRDLVFLVDYEFLGQKQSGLDWIEREGLANNAVLVTSRYDDPKVKAAAANLNIKIVPKSLSAIVPLEIALPRIKYDAALLDDDELVQLTWQAVANQKGRSILTFSEPSELVARAPTIDPETPVFIDVNLGQNKSGFEVAAHMANLGFSSIYFATGYPAESISKPGYVTGVVGKDPIL